MTPSNTTESGTLVIGPRHAGPNPGLVATVFTILFLAGLAFVTLGGGGFPTPFQPPEAMAAYFNTHATQAMLNAFFQFGSAIPLGIYTATMTSRLRFQGVRAAGIDIALFGGFAASFLLMVSALVQWSLARSGIAADVPLVQALYSLIFATGGPGYTVALGLLIAGISVPALFYRLLPKWLCVCGLVLAVIGELSTLSLVLPQVSLLIPLTRFPGFLWLIAAGFTLQNHRTSRQEL